jgi:hypothetical protein
MISSTLLTLIVIPAIYGLVKQRGLRSESSAGDAVGRSVGPDTAASSPMR